MRDHVWWKELHWPEYAAELLGTAFLLFAGVSAVVFDFGTGSPLTQVLPDASIRRLITGRLFAGSGALVAISPLGKLSGGHINPAVSLAFWMQGKMHPLWMVFLAEASLTFMLVLSNFRVCQPPSPDALDTAHGLDSGGGDGVAGGAHLRYQPQSGTQFWARPGFRVLVFPLALLGGSSPWRWAFRRRRKAPYRR